MSKLNFFIIATVFGVVFAGAAEAASLDELYRDIVRSDNQGYLPMFVKNRHAPELLFDEDVPPPEKYEEKDEAPISLVNERKLREEAERAARLKWQQTLKAVEENRVTPLDLEEIMRRAEKNQPDAVEVYAWMNAKGIGLEPNLPKAFQLYLQAAELQVPQAQQNAALVYRSMSKEQRELLQGYQP